MNKARKNQVKKKKIIVQAISKVSSHLHDALRAPGVSFSLLTGHYALTVTSDLTWGEITGSRLAEPVISLVSVSLWSRQVCVFYLLVYLLLKISCYVCLCSLSSFFLSIHVRFFLLITFLYSFVFSVYFFIHTHIRFSSFSYLLFSFVFLPNFLILPYFSFYLLPISFYFPSSPF